MRVGGFGSAAFECVLSVQVCTGTGREETESRKNNNTKSD